MESIIQANWLLRDAVAHLLKTALQGGKSFTFQSSWMDNNSMALYTILVDRLTNKLSDMDKNIITFEKPVISAPSETSVWECPLCAKENDISSKTCLCGVEMKVLVFSQQRDVAGLFNDIETLFMRIVHTVTAPPRNEPNEESDNIKKTILTNLDNEIMRLIRSSKMLSMVSRGWKITQMIENFLKSLLLSTNIKLEILFTIDNDSDMNSIGLYAVLVNQIIKKWTSLCERNPPYQKVTIEKPHADCLPEDYSYENFDLHIFPVHSNTITFLQHHKKLLLAICNQIALGGESQEWVIITI
jgi:hypothetical protein